MDHTKNSKNEDDAKLRIYVNLADVFHRKFTEGALELVMRAASEIPLEAFDSAVDKLLTTSKFMPSIAEIIEVSQQFIVEPVSECIHWSQEQAIAFIQLQEDQLDEDKTV